MTEDTKFLEELSEARMYRRLSLIKGESVDSLASKLFSHLLALRVIIHEDPDAGLGYLNEIMKFPMFKEFKVSQPDMYNLIVICLNQYDYADKVFNNWDIKIPEMRLRRIMRALLRGKDPKNDFGGFMILFQRMIPDLSSRQVQIRRAVTQWDDLAPSSKGTVIRWLITDMRERKIQSDMWELLKATARKAGYI